MQLFWAPSQMGRRNELCDTLVQTMMYGIYKECKLIAHNWMTIDSVVTGFSLCKTKIKGYKVMPFYKSMVMQS